MPFSVKIRSGLNWMISSQILCIYSSSIWRMRAKSCSWLISKLVCKDNQVLMIKNITVLWHFWHPCVISHTKDKPFILNFASTLHNAGNQKLIILMMKMVMLTWLSPFLYSKEQSKSSILGFSILLLILGWVTSLFSITPVSTLESSMIPPGTWERAGQGTFTTHILGSQLLVSYKLSIFMRWPYLNSKSSHFVL